VALAIEACAAARALQGDLSSLFTFLVQEGLADSDALVRAGMLQVILTLVLICHYTISFTILHMIIPIKLLQLRSLAARVAKSQRFSAEDW
jgi:hypothetical protein